MFKVLSQQENVRRGIIKTTHGNIVTPAFMPDATYGAVKMLSFQDVKNTGIKQILCTTLHLYIRPGDKYIKRMGGLHNFLSWDGPILTDCGGWQVFSLIHQTGKGKVDENGATFVMPEDGRKHELTPESSINIQANLRSDIILVLDDPIVGASSFKENKRSVELTLIWAKKAKMEFYKRFQLNDEKFERIEKFKRPLLFCIIQGGNYKRLRKLCAEKLIEIGFDGFGFGGGHYEGKFEKDKISYDLFRYVASLIPQDKVRYGMGIGRPEDIEFCLKCGYDLFDCVVPTRNGRHGQCFTSFGCINLKSSKYKYDNRPIDRKCDCEACRYVGKRPSATRAYLHHLLKINEPAGMRLCSIHNLRHYARLLEPTTNSKSFDIAQDK